MPVVVLSVNEAARPHARVQLVCIARRRRRSVCRSAAHLSCCAIRRRPSLPVIKPFSSITARHRSLWPLLVDLRVLCLNLRLYLRLILVELLDLLDRLLRLRRRSFQVDNGRVASRLAPPSNFICPFTLSNWISPRFSVVILLVWQAAVNCTRRFSEASGMRAFNAL